jgi:siroheme synthase
MDEGRCPLTPAIAVENAGRPEARLLHATLDTLGPAVDAAGLSGPVLLVVGEVTALARGAEVQPAESRRSASARS